jgi:hypothetical protein
MLFRTVAWIDNTLFGNEMLMADQISVTIRSHNCFVEVSCAHSESTEDAV